MTGSESFFRLEAKEVLEKLESRPEGLSAHEAAMRLAKFGYNEIAAIERPKPWRLFLGQFADPLIYILLVAAVVTTLLHEYIDTYVILAVVVLNAVIGFSQEYRAEKAIGALARLTAPRSRVLRENTELEVDSRELVPGDIVFLAAGNRVPADIRLLETIRLEVDESTLTGESSAVRKSPETIKEESPPLGDRKNVAFMGTVVLSGRGKGVVFATGKATEIGQISEKVKSIGPVPTPLQLQFVRLGKLIGLAVLSLSALAFLGGLLAGMPVTEILLVAIALAVAAIPEGLPVVFTLTLAVGVNRMAKRNAIIRRLPAVETLGSCTVIASDKTGTLTKNQMTVQQIFAGGDCFMVSGTGFIPEGKIFRAGETEKEALASDYPALRLCLLAGLLANESDLEFNREKGYTAVGDPTEAALIVSALKGGIDREEFRRKYVLLDEIPFESEKFYMATLYRLPNGSENIIFVKGAPEKVLTMCDAALDREGHPAPLDRPALLESYRRMAKEGLRVLAMAYKTMDSNITELTGDLTERGLIFAGLQGMMDPPREEAVEAVRLAQQAGVRVVMVTGDHQVTGLAIAQKLGIARGDEEEVLTGGDIDRLTDEELLQKTAVVSVYARVSPLNKLRIVEQMIKRGETVAVTGDGVNDAPALKAAHIGVAMGKSGTDVAKETSDMIITDDNFASIFAAVEEGRVVFSNLRKATFFLLSTGSGVILLILLILLTGLPLPFLPAQILWLNLVTNGLQDVALAFEPKEKGILDQPPRKAGEPIANRLMALRLFFVGLIMMAGTFHVFRGQLLSGATLAEARTVALTTMVMFQMFHVFNSRSELASVFRIPLFTNRFLFFSVLAALAAHLGVIYLAPLQLVFRTTPLTLAHWGTVVGMAAIIILWVELEKAVRRSFNKKLP